MGDKSRKISVLNFRLVISFFFNFFSLVPTKIEKKQYFPFEDDISIIYKSSRGDPVTPPDVECN